jgi:hypothetical protein
MITLFTFDHKDRCIITQPTSNPTSSHVFERCKPRPVCCCAPLARKAEPIRPPNPPNQPDRRRFPFLRPRLLPSRGEALRPKGFSHRLRDEKSLVCYALGSRGTGPPLPASQRSENGCRIHFAGWSRRSAADHPANRCERDGRIRASILVANYWYLLVIPGIAGAVSEYAVLRVVGRYGIALQNILGAAIALIPVLLGIAPFGCR